MTAPVDVLAVMDRAALAIRSDFSTRANPDPDKVLREARAAVAELIEAARWADEMIAQHARNEDGQTLDTTPLRAALARVGGAP